jgi:hypothetical protein
MLEHLTDTALQAHIAKAKELGLPTRYDEILLGVHPEDRYDCVTSAHRRLSMTMDAGRPSDALYGEAQHYRKAAA